jgi:glutaconate CoA-transferase subunit A
MPQDWLLGSADALAAQLPDGAKIAVPHDTLGVAMETTRALIRRGAKNLHVVCVPVGGLQVDLLIGANCVATLETSAVTFGENGTPYRFHDALPRDAFRMLDATCPAIHAALEAGRKNIPFIPLRGLLGSDLVVHRPDWKIIDNPFAKDDPIALLPAIRPDFALFHAPYADRAGNIFIGRRRELATMTQASVGGALVTVEEVRDVDLLASEETAAGTLPALYVTHAAIAKRGAWPCGLWDLYPNDEAHFRHYGELARTDDGFARYLEEFVHLRRQAAE